VNAAGRWHLNKRWQLRGQWFFTSGVPFTRPLGFYWEHYSGFESGRYEPWGHRDEPAYGPVNGARRPPYHRLDISVVYHFQWKEKPWEFSINLINAYVRFNVIAYDSQGNALIQMPPLLTLAIRGQLW